MQKRNIPVPLPTSPAKGVRAAGPGWVSPLRPPPRPAVPSPSHPRPCPRGCRRWGVGMAWWRGGAGMRRALHARAALGPGVSPRPRRPLRTVTVINMACTCDPHGAGGAASPEPGSWPSPRLVALVPCPWRLSRRSCAAAVVGKQQTVLPGKPFPRLLFGSSVCYAACLLMEKHGAAWLFYLLLIFLFSFFSLLFSSLLHTPPTPPHPFYFFFLLPGFIFIPIHHSGNSSSCTSPLTKEACA